MAYFLLYIFTEKVRTIMTSHRLGYGAGYPYLSYGYPGPGCGYGWGRGFGSGFKWNHFGFSPFRGYLLPQAVTDSPIPGFRSIDDPWGAAILNPEQEISLLKAEAKLLEDELARIEKKIRELEGKKKKL